MAKYQVGVTETFYSYILVDAENEKEATKLAITKRDPLGMEYSNDFYQEKSRIAVESILPFEENEEARWPAMEAEMSKFYALLNKLN
jgi:hypothetical protein